MNRGSPSASRPAAGPTPGPLTRLAATAALSVGAVGVLLLVPAALVSGGRGVGAAALGVGAVLLPALLTLVMAWVGERSGADPAPVLLLGYLVKVLVAGLVLLLVPLPEDWPAGWVLTGAGLGVLALLTAESLQVRRLRIPYFTPRPPEAHSRDTVSRRTP